MAAFMKPYSAQTFAAFRIIVGLLFMSHGLQKIFGLFGGMPPEAPDFVRWGAGGIELLGGAFVAVGFMTRWAAFFASGLMAAAYWMAHGTKAFHPILNQGELAVVYCFAFLFIAAHGAGIWSVDGERVDGAGRQAVGTRGTLITIFGAGAIGLVLAARLARTGNPVRVCTRRDEDAQQITALGIDVEEPETEARWNARVVAQVGPPVDERDAIFTCVRGPDARVAAAQIAAASPDALIVNVQNGIDGDAIFAERFERVVGAVIRHNCTRVDARFARSRRSARIIVGAHPDGAGRDVDAIAALLRGAGYDTGISARIADDRWLKLCVNLMSTPNALVRPADHETRAFTEGKARLLEEARDALAAAGITARSCDGRDRSLDAEIAFQRGALARGVAARKLPLYNSLWQGLARGAALEVDAYHRRVMELGARHGVATPVNAHVLEGLERVIRDGLGPESLGAAELLGDG